MKTWTCKKAAFAVIGKEGSTNDGEGFVQRLWADANGHFDEVAPLAKRDENGNLAGVWGAMTDFSRSFAVWEDGFSRGLYLAGVECRDDAAAPEGWVRWELPAHEYLCVEDAPFPEALAELQSRGLQVTGAVQEFTDPATGKECLYFPIDPA